MEQLRVGLLILAAAPVAWLVGAVATDTSGFLLPLLVTLAGAAVAVWALPQGRVLGALAMALAAFGIALFYDFDLWSDLEASGGGIVFLGVLIGAGAVAADAPRGLAAGLAVMASGGVLWVYIDALDGAWEWQPGNVLLVAGSGVTAVAAWRNG